MEDQFKNFTSKQLESAVISFFQEGDNTMLKRLYMNIELVSKLDTVINNRHALNCALNSGDIELAQIILFSPEIKQKNLGEIRIDYAAKGNHWDLVKNLLTKKDLIINKSILKKHVTETFRYACSQPNEEMIQWLIKKSPIKPQVKEIHIIDILRASDTKALETFMLSSSLNIDLIYEISQKIVLNEEIEKYLQTLNMYSSLKKQIKNTSQKSSNKKI